MRLIVASRLTSSFPEPAFRLTISHTNYSLKIFEAILEKGYHDFYKHYDVILVKRKTTKALIKIIDQGVWHIFN